jgi:hypothetical protein
MEPVPDDIFYLPDRLFGDADDDARVDPSAVAARAHAARLRTTYEFVVDRLRREAGKSLTTLELLLLERIAFNYVSMRGKEAAAGTERGFAHATAQKDYNTFWLALVQEFNKQTRQSDAEFREALVSQVGVIVKDLIATVEDPDLRQRLRAGMADKLEQAGL